jgi:hypothetical protein
VRISRPCHHLPNSAARLPHGFTTAEETNVKQAAQLEENWPFPRFLVELSYMIGRAAKQCSMDV